ncbi:Glycoside hydrolase family 15 carbohydrate-binding module family 21 protein, partial [Globisporangium polare]
MVFAAVRNVLAILLVAAVCASAQEVKVNSYSYNGAALTGSLS